MWVSFKLIQFPARVAFAVTINKSQAQSLQGCGFNLETHCFSHGQLYVRWMFTCWFPNEANTKHVYQKAWQ